MAAIPYYYGELYRAVPPPPPAASHPAAPDTYYPPPPADWRSATPPGGCEPPRPPYAPYAVGAPAPPPRAPLPAYYAYPPEADPYAAYYYYYGCPPAVCAPGGYAAPVDAYGGHPAALTLQPPPDAAPAAPADTTVISSTNERATATPSCLSAATASAERGGGEGGATRGQRRKVLTPFNIVRFSAKNCLLCGEADHSYNNCFNLFNNKMLCFFNEANCGVYIFEEHTAKLGTGPRQRRPGAAGKAEYDWMTTCLVGDLVRFVYSDILKQPVAAAGDGTLDLAAHDTALFVGGKNLWDTTQQALRCLQSQTRRAAAPGDRPAAARRNVFSRQQLELPCAQLQLFPGGLVYVGRLSSGWDGTEGPAPAACGEYEDAAQAQQMPIVSDSAPAPRPAEETARKPASATTTTATATAASTAPPPAEGAEAAPQDGTRADGDEDTVAAAALQPPPSVDAKHDAAEALTEEEARRRRTLHVKFIPIHLRDAAVRELITMQEALVIHRVRAVRPAHARSSAGRGKSGVFFVCFVEYATEAECRRALVFLSGKRVNGGFYLQAQLSKQCIKGGFITDYNPGDPAVPCTYGVRPGGFHALPAAAAADNAANEKEEPQEPAKPSPLRTVIHNLMRQLEASKSAAPSADREIKTSSKNGEAPVEESAATAAAEKEEKEAGSSEADGVCCATPVAQRAAAPECPQQTPPSAGAEDTATASALTTVGYPSSSKDAARTADTKRSGSASPASCSPRVLFHVPLPHSADREAAEGTTPAPERCGGDGSPAPAVPCAATCAVAEMLEKRGALHAATHDYLALLRAAEKEREGGGSDAAEEAASAAADSAESAFYALLGMTEQLSCHPVAPDDDAHSMLLFRAELLVYQAALFFRHQTAGGGPAAASGDHSDAVQACQYVQELVTLAHTLVHHVSCLRRVAAAHPAPPGSDDGSGHRAACIALMSTTFQRDVEWQKLFCAAPLAAQEAATRPGSPVLEAALRWCELAAHPPPPAGTSAADAPFLSPRVEAVYCLFQRLAQCALLLDEYLGAVCEASGGAGSRVCGPGAPPDIITLLRHLIRAVECARSLMQCLRPLLGAATGALAALDRRLLARLPSPAAVIRGDAVGTVLRCVRADTRTVIGGQALSATEQIMCGEGELRLQ